jgi:light-regulated signal transduction histidine kinase (bacteriophytochrome)/CheY-like chemotaxis protein
MAQAVNLTNCDEEPIQFPGSIQGHGCLLACDEMGRVLRLSANAPAVLRLPQDFAGKTISELLSQKLAHDLFNALAKSSDPSRPALIRGLTMGDVCFDVSCHLWQGVAIFEFEEAEPPIAANDPLEITRALIAKTVKLTTLDALYGPLPHYLSAMFGYDRAMIYAFAHDGSGKVVGESRRHDLESFLGQHFPAGDIPRQARELYLKNTIRVISDATGRANRLIPECDSGEDSLDLSFAHLRSVSPIHLEYLRNMGVAASMSISIIVEGQLWGLVACHHYAPKALTMSQRIAAELFGDFLSLHITSIYQRARAAASASARRALDNIFNSLSFHQSAEGFLRESLREFGNVVRSDGVGLWMNGTWSSYGLSPSEHAVARLVNLSAERGEGGIWSTDNLSHYLGSASEVASDVSGMLAVPLSLTKRDHLLFFRREKLQTLNWAGDPNKNYPTGPNGDRLTPRKSFAIWKETIADHCDPWDEDDHIAAQSVLFGLREIIMKQNEILDAERKKSEVRMRILNDELNHRVKNILALIKSLVNQPTAGQSIEEFVVGLQGRILALANAHDQVVRADGGGLLQQLFHAELSPYPASQIAMDGPDLALDARAYSVMALVIHELATNCAKYGALSVPVGKLTVSWRLVGDFGLEIEWRENGGPRVEAPSRNGFGSVLLERSVPFDLQGRSEIHFFPSGVHAFFSIPQRFITQLRGEHSPVHSRKAEKQTPDVNAQIVSEFLLVEDQLIIALEAEEMLRRFGAKKVVTVATESDALQALRTFVPEFAILDVNLGFNTSISVAEELSRLAVPFIFATGYGDSVMIPEKFRHVPVVRKPYTAETVAFGLARARASASR